MYIFSFSLQDQNIKFYVPYYTFFKNSISIKHFVYANKSYPHERKSSSEKPSFFHCFYANHISFHCLLVLKFHSSRNSTIHYTFIWYRLRISLVAIYQKYLTNSDLTDRGLFSHVTSLEVDGSCLWISYSAT